MAAARVISLLHWPPNYSNLSPDYRLMIAAAAGSTQFNPSLAADLRSIALLVDCEDNGNQQSAAQALAILLRRASGSQAGRFDHVYEVYDDCGSVGCPPVRRAEVSSPLIVGAAPEDAISVVGLLRNLSGGSLNLGRECAQCIGAARPSATVKEMIKIKKAAPVLFFEPHKNSTNPLGIRHPMIGSKEMVSLNGMTESVTAVVVAEIRYSAGRSGDGQIHGTNGHYTVAELTKEGTVSYYDPASTAPTKERAPYWKTDGIVPDINDGEERDEYDSDQIATVYVIKLQSKQILTGTPSNTCSRVQLAKLGYAANGQPSGKPVDVYDNHALPVSKRKRDLISAVGLGSNNFVVISLFDGASSTLRAIENLTGALPNAAILAENDPTIREIVAEEHDISNTNLLWNKSRRGYPIRYLSNVWECIQNCPSPIDEL